MITIDDQPIFTEEYDLVEKQAQERRGFSYLKKLKELVIGSGDTSFRADKNGIWLGNAVFANAPFRVNMAGAITASNLTITGGSLAIGTNAYHMDNSGNMWWGNFASYATATIKISSAGVANLSGLVVGTNVGIGTAFPAASAGDMAFEDLVTLAKLDNTIIVGGYIKTSLLTADNIITGTLTGRRIKTAADGVNRLEILSPGYASYITWWNAANNLQSFIVDDFTGHLLIYAPTFVEIGPLLSVQGNIAVTGNIAVAGTVDGLDISAFITNNYNPLVTDYISHIGNASAHHSSVSDNLTITPANVDIKADGYIKRAGTNCVRLISNAFDLYKAIGLLATSTPPADAYNGLMFYHTTYHEVWVFKNGSWKALAYVP